MGRKDHLILLLLLLVKGLSPSPEKQNCPCLLHFQGQIDDCVCTVDAIDELNNKKLYPLLQDLLQHDYFRYFKVNLNRDCPFWPDDSQCGRIQCQVETCPEDQVPPGLKGAQYAVNINGDSPQVPDDCDENHGGLGSIDKTISDENYQDFVRWQNHDNALVNFCDLDDENSQDAQYVDLLLNPERFTGYAGQSAHRIWKSIYDENCFRLGEGYGPYTTSKNLQAMCYEKRAFYRAISGLHSSINIHLCSQYYFPRQNYLTPEYWGPNVKEFLRRFDPNNSGLHYLMNLYFLYLVELRALTKAAPLLTAESYFTGNSEDDQKVQHLIKEFLNITSDFPYHFDESVMFINEDPRSLRLKEEFREHFRNISRIIKCVGCDKCRLWGKLQIQGLGTAFKILFFGKSHGEIDMAEVKRKKFKLTRTELVSLFNAFGRLSNSIHQLEVFKELIERDKDKYMPRETKKAKPMNKKLEL